MVDRPHKPSAINPSPATPQPHIDISPDNSKVTATLASGDSVEVLLHGATVISWKTKGTENLWLSDAAVLDGSKAVRGGVPVVFPGFGKPPPNHEVSSLPQHGFARNVKWEYLGKNPSESSSSANGGSSDSDSVKLDFGLGSAQVPNSYRELWPHDFSLVYSVTLSGGSGGDAKPSLQSALLIRNEGKTSWEFQMLLHTYFRIREISRTTVTGLLGVEYIDKVGGGEGFHATQSDHEIKFQGEVDRIYPNIPQDTTSIVVDGQPRFDVVRDNLKDTVVWNPWIAKSKSMSDFEPKDGYKEMVCVEVGAVDGFQKLEPGEAFEAGQVVRSLI